MSIFDSISKGFTGFRNSLKANRATNLKAATGLIGATKVTSSAKAATKAPSLLKSAGKLVTDAFSSLKPTTKLAVVAATPIAAGTLVSSSKARKDLIKAPASLYNFGSNLGKLYDSPSLSSAAAVAKENPLLTTAAVAGGALILGKGAQLAATAANTAAINKSNKSFGEQFSGYLEKSASTKSTAKAAELQADTEYKLAKLQADTMLEVEREKTKQLKIQSELQPITPTGATATAATGSSTPVAATPLSAPKKKRKKKSKKKKAKKKKSRKTSSKKRKKSKSIKRKAPKKKKKKAKRRKRARTR